MAMYYILLLIKFYALNITIIFMNLNSNNCKKKIKSILTILRSYGMDKKRKIKVHLILLPIMIYKIILF